MTSLLHAAECHEAEAALERAEYLRGLGVLGGRVLDVGCGNGYSLPELSKQGMSAVGVDYSFYRMSRWRAEGLSGRHLVVASAGALPFRPNQFDTVVSSGMLEHIGVSEQASPYSVTALPQKLTHRASAVSELSRVCSGNLVLDFPNGWFPVDFWHGNSLGAFRLHSVPDTLNPSLHELRSYLPGIKVTLLPLRNRLRFRQVTTKRWGRILAPATQLFIRLLDHLPRGLPFLALLYPYLVLRVEPASSNKALQRTRYARR